MNVLVLVAILGVPLAYALLGAMTYRLITAPDDRGRDEWLMLIWPGLWVLGFLVGVVWLIRKVAGLER